MRRWLRQFSKRWDWLQVEISSQCHAACIYCPTAIYRNEGSNQLMSLGTFQRLSPAFSRARLVYLQGWGEPFLNPNIIEMVQMAKVAGCQVGMTTNGMLLDAARLNEIIHCGVDVITFSLAGCNETNNIIRKGTHLAQVLEIARQLKLLKEQTRTTHPEVHIAYMLLRSGLDEIRQLPDLLHGLDITQVVISTLDFIPSLALEHEALIPTSQEEYLSWRACLDEMAAKGKKSNTDIHYQLVSFGKEKQATDNDLDIVLFFPVAWPTCTEHIQNAAFISANGDITPCVFTHLPVLTPETIPLQTGRPYQPMIFGNIHDQSLEAIWETKAYLEFRRSHRAGNLTGVCKYCLKPRVQII